MSVATFSDRAGLYVELAGKGILIAAFGVGSSLRAFAIASLLNNWSTVEPLTRWTYLAAHLTALAFMALVIATTIVRHRPVRRAEGIEPRVSALAGTFLALSLGLLPPSDISAGVSLIGVGMSAIGGLLSACVLLWLGRSFSIMAQARRLVTSGPYAFVRHPLYLTEELMALGVMLLVVSPLAVVIVCVHWIFQLRRMVNEERVLRGSFPEYAAYAARTPRIVPRPLRLRAPSGF